MPVTDAPAFGVETIELDLPPLVGALSRRLHDSGVPVTPGRSVDFARALTLVRPVSRRRLYWTARAVFVSDPAQVDAFDRVFFSVFGGPPLGEDFDPEDAQTVAAPPDDRPAADHKTSPRGTRAAASRHERHRVAAGRARTGRRWRRAGRAAADGE